MSVAPSNPLSLAEERLQITLADSPTFRTLTGAADRAAARAHIYSQALPAPVGAEYTVAELTALRPFAITYVAPEEGYTADAEGAPEGNYASRGEFVILLESGVDPAATEGDQNRTWLNVLGGILGELFQVPGSGDYLNVAEVRLREYGRTPDERLYTDGEYVYALLGVRWTTGMG